MKSFIALAGISALLVFASGSANAATCNVDGTTYTCEASCTGTGACNIETSVGHAACDSVNNPPGNNDGYCVICGDGQNNNITGTVGKDIICGKGGNDIINGDPSGASGDDDILNGEAGNDSIQGRLGNDTIYGGTGNDIIHGNEGDDTIYGEENDDTINGNDGDDEIDGGTGNDTIYGDLGADVLRGGAGNDFIEDTYGYYVQGQLGGILCGGDGDDVLQILGHGSFCFDGGPGQTGANWATGYDCRYLGPPSNGTVADLGTYRNCIAPYAEPGWNASHRSCNCQD